MFAARQGFIGAAGSGGSIVYGITDTFTSSSTWVAPAGVTSVRILAVGGGGAGGCGWEGGGGGAGGFVDQTFAVTAGTTYTITIGAGGSGVYNVNGAASGQATTVADGGTTLCNALGGGRGGGEPGTAATIATSLAYSGGSGGAGSQFTDSLNATSGFNSGADLYGNISIQNSSVGYGQGNDGGAGRGQPNGTTGGITCNDYILIGGGGGGAGAAGGDWSLTGGASGTLSAGDGGDGATSDITGSTEYYAGGGGGGIRPVFNNLTGYVPGTGGSGGGQTAVPNNAGQTGGGTANTGGGGAGSCKSSNAGPTVNAGSGGSGFVAIAY